MSTMRGAARMQIERRSSRRYRFEAGLEMQWGSAALPGRVRDISAGGVLVETADPLWMGASFEAILALDGAPRVECVVRRVVPMKGVGLTYIARDPLAQERLNALLKSLAGK